MSTALSLTVRPIQAHEYSILGDFLLEAIFVPEGSARPPRSLLASPDLAVYIDGFGSGKADFCVVAELNGLIIGAAWARLMKDYGHIANATPSIAISVLPDQRGRGVGTALLEALLHAIEQAGYEAVSLSVQKANRALHLYRRLGFRTAADHGDELILIRTFL